LPPKTRCWSRFSRRPSRSRPATNRLRD
jgi:hypothetical protein